MTVAPADEAPRDVAGDRSDAVTIAFADPQADVCGVARVGIADVDGTPTASGLALLFAGGEPVAVRAEGGIAPGGAAWEDTTVAGVQTSVVDPLQAWRVSFADESGEHGFTLDLAARSLPAELAPDSPVGKLGGMEGYEQLVDVTGEVRVGGRARPFRGAGQRGHSWGSPDWLKLSVSRTLGVWLEDGGGVTLSAVRPAKGQTHADEVLQVTLLDVPEDGGEAVPALVADPRLSTAYDGEGRQQHAGLELYVDAEDDHARRTAGELVCGTTLDLGTLRLDCAFFRWRMEGRAGVGRYDILRRKD